MMIKFFFFFAFTFFFVALKFPIVIGFSVGDELGFPESLGNVEGSKRRALNLRTGANSIGVLPAAKMPVRLITSFHTQCAIKSLSCSLDY